MNNNITVFGKHIIDDAAILQLENCLIPGAIGVLTADAHKGYSMPVGGCIAYKDFISPSGVGYDIGCISGDAEILLLNRSFILMNNVQKNDAIVSINDQGHAYILNKNEGLIYTGEKSVVEVALTNGRILICTPDHLIMTMSGWKKVNELLDTDYILNSVFRGYNFENYDFKLPAPYQDINIDTFACLLRILGLIMTDGHISLDGKYISIYTAMSEDVASIINDLNALDLKPCHHYRERKNTKENNIKINSTIFNAFIQKLGCPAGKKALKWNYDDMKWLLTLPKWLLSNFMSGVLSGEATQPRIRQDGTVSNIAIKQAGNIDFLNLLKDIFKILNFKTSSITLSDDIKSTLNHTYHIQVLGGAEEQIKVFEKIGFCYHAYKRRKAAFVSSMYFERKYIINKRQKAYLVSKELRAEGMKIRDVMSLVSKEYDVSTSFVFHSIYSNRSESRIHKKTVELKTYEFGESYFSKVHSITPKGYTKVYDIITSDPLHRFNANGLVVHNCGNMAVQTNALADDVHIPHIMNEIARRISFGIGRPNNEPVDHEVLDKIAAAEFMPQRKMAQLAKSQLGTVGSGNHYVDLFKDENGYIWIGVHFGSRGFGHKTASGFLALAQGLDFDTHAKGESMDAKPTLLSIHDTIGQDYIAAMNLAGEYAYAGRETVINKVLEILGNPEVTFSVHNHHNFAWEETHFGEKYWVVRKGCTPAFPGQQGFIGANMRDISVIVEGIDSLAARNGLYSTVHGAGRILSRTQAAGKKKWIRGDDGKKRATIVGKGLVDFEAVQHELQGHKIELRGGGADEAPQCYKSLVDVLGYHSETITILHKLTPIGVAMAGLHEHDPYKD